MCYVHCMPSKYKFRIMSPVQDEKGYLKIKQKLATEAKKRNLSVSKLFWLGMSSIPSCDFTSSKDL